MNQNDIDPIMLLQILNSQLFSSTTDKPTTKDLVALAGQRASPYGTVSIKQSNKMSMPEFFQRFLLPMAFDLFNAMQLKKPILDEKTIDKLTKELPDLAKYIEKDKETQQYKFKDIDKAPEEIKDIHAKIQELEEARKKILTNPRVYLQPGTLTSMLQDPHLSSLLFSGQDMLVKSIKESKKKKVLDNLTKKVLEKVGVDVKEQEGVGFEDLNQLMPFILLNVLGK